MQIFKTKRERKEYWRKEFEKLLRKHRYLLVINTSGLKAKLLNIIRGFSHKYNYTVKGGKNGVLLKAIKNEYPNSFSHIKNLLTGQNLFIFTNDNPIDIALKLSEVEVTIPASPGTIAPKDIVISKGNTGIPPGPIIGLFSSLGVPTKIIGGTIHVTKDIVIVKKGERVSLDAASLLSKLKIEPITARIQLKFAYDFMDNILFREDTLLPDVEKLRNDIKLGISNALSLSIGIKYPTSKTIPIFIGQATRAAMQLAIRLKYITDRNLVPMIRVAVNIARKLSEELKDYE